MRLIRLQFAYSLVALFWYGYDIHSSEEVSEARIWRNSVLSGVGKQDLKNSDRMPFLPASFLFSIAWTSENFQFVETGFVLAYVAWWHHTDEVSGREVEHLAEVSEKIYEASVGIPIWSDQHHVTWKEVVVSSAVVAFSMWSIISRQHHFCRFRWVCSFVAKVAVIGGVTQSW